jgi:hypothetical protein
MHHEFAPLRPTCVLKTHHSGRFRPTRVGKSVGEDPHELLCQGVFDITKETSFVGYLFPCLKLFVPLDNLQKNKTLV